MRPLDFGSLLVMGALWGASYLFIRIGVADFGPAPLMAGRVALAALVLWVALRTLGRQVVVRPYAGRLLVMGLINAALPFTLIAWAELDLNASLAAVLGATVPLFGALIGAVWMRDRITLTRGAGLLVGLGGVVVLTGFSPVQLDRTALLAIAATLFASMLYATSGFYAKTNIFPSLAIQRLQRTLSGHYELTLRAAEDLDIGTKELTVRVKRRGATVLAPATVSIRR